MALATRVAPHRLSPGVLLQEGSGGSLRNADGDGCFGEGEAGDGKGAGSNPRQKRASKSVSAIGGDIRFGHDLTRYVLCASVCVRDGLGVRSWRRRFMSAVFFSHFGPDPLFLHLTSSSPCNPLILSISVCCSLAWSLGPSILTVWLGTRLGTTG
jgi:hypothetical protein